METKPSSSITDNTRIIDLLTIFMVMDLLLEEAVLTLDLNVKNKKTKSVCILVL
jgi:hypothetical protein